MLKPAMGAQVQFCGHKGSFIADVWVIAGVNVVVASGPVTPANLDRETTPTHRLVDFPSAGYWRPQKGIFVVPQKQVVEL